MQDILFIEMLSNLALIGIFFLALIATIFFIYSRGRIMKLLEKLLKAKKFSVEEKLLAECATAIGDAGHDIREMTVKLVASMVGATAKEVVSMLNKDVPEEPEPDPDKKSDSEVEDQTSKTD